MSEAISSTLDLTKCHVESVLGEYFGRSFTARPHGRQPTQCCNNVRCDKNCLCHKGVTAREIARHEFEITFCGLSQSGVMVDATGAVQSLDFDSLMRTAAAALFRFEQEQQVEDLNQQLEYFVEQVSGDLEEACWFRTMAEQVAECRADDPMQALCDRILSQLRDLLHTRSIWVLEEAIGEQPVVVAMEADAGETAGRPEAVLQILANYRDVAWNEAIVWNREFFDGSEGRSGNQFPAWLDGFVLVRIGTQSHHFGWLIAAERSDTFGDAAQSRQSEAEFGTHEATLMETAGVLLATHASNRQLFEEQEKTLIGVVTAMVNALDARDPYTRGHSHRVALISRRISEKLGLPEEQVEDIYLSGLLHDIGKIGVADHVLLKNGPLDQDERRQIEQHTVIGHSILNPVKQLTKILPGVLHHHEQMDGSGYPSRLHGVDIPLAGRIIAVADAYDAMTTCRPYRNAMPIQKAEHILLEGAGTHWDEAMIDAFFAVRDEVSEIYRASKAMEQQSPQSAMQFGRFEDVSLSGVASLSPVGPSKE